MIHELIFVNSGSNYYVRLPVDFHAALISDNNSGKTSSLSALKLFLLPEISFKKQDDKFGFASGGKYFKDISSYTYYFPGTESYIICNASNPKGRFCWILYRSTDLEYERIAVPHDYDSFEYLFWNKDSKKNENAGELWPHIGIADIKKKLISDFSGKIFTDKKSIGDAIYSRTSNVDDDSRFCILPMAKGYSSSITETIRSLLNMAFSLGDASTTSLPKAIASILDSAGMSAVRKSNSEGIFLDLDSQLTEWNELKSIDTKLKLIASQKDNWSQLQKSHSDHKRLQRKTIDHFNEIVWCLEHRRSTLKAQLSKLEEKAKKAEAELNAYLPLHQESESKYNEAKAAEAAAKRVLKDINDHIERANQARGRLQPLCPEDDRSDQAILNVLEEQIQHCRSEIEGLRDTAKAIDLMGELDKSIKANTDTKTSLNNAVISLESQTSFLDGLSVHAASILLSLNQDFARLSFTPTSDQASIIESFASLFSVKNKKLDFCNVTLLRTEYLERNNEAIKQKHKMEISRLDISINGDMSQLIRLRKNYELSKEHQSAKLIECSRELEELNQEKKALSIADGLKALLHDAEEELGIALAKFEQAKIDKEATQIVRDQLKSTLTLIIANIADQSLPLRQIEEHFTRLNRIEAVSSTLLDLNKALLEFDAERVRDISTEETEASLNELQSTLKETQSCKVDALNTMSSLLEYGIVESTPEHRHDLNNTEKFDYFYSDLQTVFFNLDKSRESYKERLVHHNNTAAAASRMIENVQGIITNFINGINEELQGYHVSNLSSVELFAELHPQYADMVKTLSRVGSRTDELLSETFYKQISDFQDKFYIKNPGKIDIAKIIEKISYRFGRNNAIEDTPQSNGTNCMVNAVLLALLLKRMVPEDLNLTMPIIFDEVSSLDESNFQEILRVMEEHGLYLFAANPEQNGVIASVLSVYHNLSTFKATDVLVQGKAEAIYYPNMEERLESIDDQNEIVMDEI